MIAFPRTLSLRKPTLKTAKGSATLTLGGTAQLPTGAAALRLYRGKTAAGLTPSVTLAKSGTSFRGTVRIKQTAKPQIVFLQARASVAAGTATCTPTLGVQCVGATRAAVAVRSGTVRFVIPAPHVALGRLAA